MMKPSELRRAVIDFMGQPRNKSAFERAIQASGRMVYRRTIDRLLKGESISERMAAAIEAFLIDRKTIKSQDRNYEALCELFGFDNRKQATEDYTGIYRFHVHSERRRGYAVIGSMEVFSHRYKNSIVVREIQTWLGGREKWTGYLIECGQICVIFARRPLLKIPKKYVLRPARDVPKAGDRTVTSLEGRMLKVGEHGGVFSSKIVMERDLQAKQATALVPFKSLPQRIKDALGKPDHIPD